jgi:paired small multidrug resistance pump
MSWFFLILAGCFEVVGVIGITKINKSPSIRSYILLVLGFGLSFIFLSFAMKDIEMSTAYAVWTGIGTVGSALVGILLYGESKDKLRLTFIALIIFSVVGLKLVA